MIDTSLRAKIHLENQRRKRAQPLVLQFLKGKRFHVIDWCDFCGSTDITIVCNRDRYGAPIRAAQCQRCGLLFLVDRLSSADYAEFYEVAYRPLVSAYLGRDVAANLMGAGQERYASNLLAALRAGPLRAGRDATRKLLDVGGSIGLVASAAARELKCAATVLDPSSEELRFAAAAGHEVIHALFEDWTPPEGGQFDLTFCCNTVDHFLDLRGSLLKLRAVTNPDGLIVINIIDFPVIWKRKGVIEGAIKIDHCYYLASENAPALLRHVGLEPVFSEIASHPEHVTYVCKPSVSTDVPRELSQWARSCLRAIQASRVEAIALEGIPYSLRERAFVWKKRFLRLWKPK